VATPLGIEILSVVTGPLRLLEDNPKPIQPREILKAADLQGRVAREIRDFLKQDDTLPNGDEPREYDYLETNRKVSQAVPLDRRVLVTSLLPKLDLGPSYLQQFDKVQPFLRDTLPRRSITTLTGIQPVEPSDLELSPYWRAWEAVEDPFTVLRDLREGILVSDQVAVLEQIYPAIYAELTKAVLMAMADRKVKDDEWEPALWQEQQIETVLQVSRLSPELAAELQDRARRAEVAQRQEEAQPSGPVSAGTGKGVQDKTVDAYQTSTQRVAYR
jgi:hypothetical protein